MPPRYAYWTIIVDEQPTAFRASSQEDLMPTLKRLMEKHPSAKMVWFQNGKVWPSRIDAQEAMRARGEMGRRGDSRQGGGFRDRDRKPRDRSERPDWKPKTSRPQDLKSPERLEWKPKGEFTPAPKRSDSSRPREFKTSRPREARPDWKPKSPFDRDRKPEWKPRGEGQRSSRPPGKLEWKPRGEGSSGSRAPASGPGGKRKWIPKEEYKKSQGIEAKRDSKWRPGGEHRDPKQKYKDAKKAKWGRFKQTIRKRWESKQGRPPGKKRRDDE